jgi:hypothetical protein
MLCWCGPGVVLGPLSIEDTLRVMSAMTSDVFCDLRHSGRRAGHTPCGSRLAAFVPLSEPGRPQVSALRHVYLPGGKERQGRRVLRLRGARRRPCLGRKQESQGGHRPFPPLRPFRAVLPRVRETGVGVRRSCFRPSPLVQRRDTSKGSPAMSNHVSPPQARRTSIEWIEERELNVGGARWSTSTGSPGSGCSRPGL